MGKFIALFSLFCSSFFKFYGITQCLLCFKKILLFFSPIKRVVDRVDASSSVLKVIASRLASKIKNKGS